MTAIIHLKSRVSPKDVEELLGHHLDESSYDALITGDARVYKPNGDPLLILRKRAIPDDILERAREPLLFLKRYKSDNRGTYAGGVRVARVKADGTVSNTPDYVDPLTGKTLSVASAVVGYYDRYPRIPFCRETAFTANEVERWSNLVPLATCVGDVFKKELPGRHLAQSDLAQRTSQDFVIKGTPFTTMTVNNTVRAAVHYDKGDLKEGFGCITALRLGRFSGFHLVFPAYRVAVDIDSNDVLLFDPHEAHGNTAMVKIDEGAERISVVYYYRADMIECGSAAEEQERAKHARGALEGGSDDQA